MPTFDVNEFRSSIESSYHRAAHFNMEIGVPTGLLIGSNNVDVKGTVDKLHFDIETTNLPGVAIGTDENRRYGIGAFTLKPYVPIFDTVNLIVRSDSEGKNYAFFQRWMQLIINYKFDAGIDGHVNKRQTYDVSYKKDYSTTVSINVYDEIGGEPTIKLVLVDAFPIHVGNSQLDWRDRDILRVPITLTFTNWYRVDDRNDDSVLVTDLPNIPGTKIIPEFTRK